MANEDKTITIRFRGDSTQLDNTVNNIDKMIKLLAYDTKALEKQMKFGKDMKSQMKLYSDALSNVSEEIKLAETNMRSWNKEMDTYSAKLKEQGSLSKEEWNNMNRAMKMTAEYSKMVENLKEQYNRLATAKINYNKISIAEALEKEAKRAGNLSISLGKLADVFKGISTVAGAALTGAAAAAISFEDAMANVRKVLRPEDAEYFEQIKKDVLELSTQLPITANEIAKVAANALQLGVRAADVSKFTEVILKLGTATDIVADEAAMSVAKFFNITGQSLQDVDKFGAALTQLGNRFETGEKAIMEMSTRLAAAGSIVGMSTDEILALSTALTSLGLNAEAGGTAISTILRNIDILVSTNSKNLKAWAEQAGMSVDEFKKAWGTDVTGTFSRLLSEISKSVSGGENLNLILSNLGINAIRQTDAFSRLVLGVDTFNDALGESKKAWDEVGQGLNGALNDEVEKRISTITAKWQMLVNSVVKLGVELGETLKPTINKILDYAQMLVTAFSDLSDETKAWIVRFLAGLAAIYPVLLGFSKLFGNWQKLLSGLAGLVRSTIKPFTSWVKDSAILKMSKALGSAAAFAKKLGVGLMNIIQNAFTAKTALSFEGFGSSYGVGEALGSMVSMMGLLKAAIIGLVAAFAILLATNEDFRNQIKEIAGGLLERLKAILESVLATLKKVGGWLSNEFSDLLETIVDLWKKYLEPALSFMLTALTQLGGSILVDIVAILGHLANILIVSIANVLEFIISLIKTVLVVLSPIISIVSTLLGKLFEFVAIIFDKLRPAFKWLFDGLEQLMSLIVGTVLAVLDGVLLAIQWIIDKITELYDLFMKSDVVQAFVAGVEMIKDAFDKISSAIQTAIDKIREFLGLNKNVDFSADVVGAGKNVSNIANVYLNNSNTFNNPSPQVAQSISDDLVRLVSNKLGKQIFQ